VLLRLPVAGVFALSHPAGNTVCVRRHYCPAGPFPLQHEALQSAVGTPSHAMRVGRQRVFRRTRLAQSSSDLMRPIAEAKSRCLVLRLVFKPAAPAAPEAARSRLTNSNPSDLARTPSLSTPFGVSQVIAGIFPLLATFCRIEHPPATKIGKINYSPFPDFWRRIPGGPGHVDETDLCERTKAPGIQRQHPVAGVERAIVVADTIYHLAVLSSVCDYAADSYLVRNSPTT
jgi:hypothetical protein